MIKSKCELCGKETEYPYKSVVKRFCSYQCSNQWKWDKLRKRGDYMPCFHCGKLKWAAKRYLENPEKYIKEGFFCSKKCFYQWRKCNPPNWLIPFPKGSVPWNKGKKLSKEFKEKCRQRAIQQWKDLEFRKKQMGRDFSKFSKSGRLALQKYREKHGVNLLVESGGGKAVQKKYLQKIGIKLQ